MRVFFAAIVMFIVAQSQCFAGELSKHEWWVYVPVEDFTWKEHGETGEKLLEESGIRFGLGLDYRYRALKGKLPLRFRGDFTYGEVDYDGHSQSGIPAKTTSTYLSWKVEGDAAWRFWFDRVVVDPMLGFGYKAWSRDIKDAGAINPATGNGVAITGYTEDWEVIYGYAGLRLETNRWRNDKWGIFGEASAKFPISAKNKVEEFGITVKPGKEVTPYVELGGWYDMVRIAGYYERMTFGQSPLSPEGAFQPESTADIFGVKVGLRF
ncbi:hypothetical protein A2G06_16770 (plasmid) [Geobacter anodireducens]|nr:hypothetical protein A2G06_16770 [Geobacter anodireducens]